ncbi:hypothetical protein [Sporolactobacillus laevolacticus]|uniref:hypothetical protein n=1 Tax=Sporolactobacillus laevolacticus TaxID=33018 RepID=UPI0025B3AB7D|nr:hypothetical protein [Sporolactobacillus laevolacticus]MDN3955899.1 hypothetical protein [Sporolactobacillus laevolacticus]
MHLEVGFIVGGTIAIVLLIIGIIAVVVSKRKAQENKWAWWVILFGVIALISGAINSGILF